MTPKFSHDGCGITVTEFEVRELDEHGDAIDVNHYDSKSMAIQESRKSKANAVVVEKHISRRPAHLFSEPDTYRTIFTSGDQSALKEGGWIT